MKLLQAQHPEAFSEPLVIQFLDLTHKPKQYDVLEYFPDSHSDFAEDKLIKTRRQTVDGRTFVVCSIFDRGASRSAAEKLHGLVERDTEKDCRNAL
jgi:predicted nuclease of restriction endonuclease-like (RecB) superfamily